MGRTEEKLPKGLVNIALLLVLGAIAPMLDSTMVNIALNDLGIEFKASIDVIQWVVTGYVLALGIAVPFSGWLLQRFDGKLVYLGAQCLFLISSALAGLAWSMDSLVVFRLVQGFSAGLIIPLLTTLLVQSAGQSNMGRLMSIVGMPIVLGPILGPVIGGLLVDNLSWRWIFYVNVPIGLIVMYLIYKRLPAFPPSHRQAKLDWPGIALLGTLSTCYIYAITRSASVDGGFGSAETLGWLGAGVALTIVYVVYAWRRPDRVIVPLNLFKYRSFAASVCALFLAGIGTNGPMLLLPLFFQNVRGDTVILAGLSLIPQGLGMLVARPWIGKLIDSIGAKWVVLCSVAITFAGTLPFLWIAQDTAYWLVAVVLFVRGIGVGGMTIPVMTDAYTGLARDQVPQASSATRIVQNIGGAFGSAVLAAMVAGHIRTAHPGVADLTAAYQFGFLIAGILTVALLVPALFLTNKLRAKARAEGGASTR